MRQCFSLPIRYLRRINNKDRHRGYIYLLTLAGLANWPFFFKKHHPKADALTNYNFRCNTVYKHMSVEQRGTIGIPSRMENNKGAKPEILPREKVRVLIPHDEEVAHYNAAVVRSRKNPSDLLIFTREVLRANVKSGTPDKGNILIVRSTPDKVEKIGRLDLSDPEINNWEDPRAFKSDEIFVDDQGIEYEKVLIGLTAIRAKDNAPVAATVRGRIVDGNFSIEEGSLQVYANDLGKNVTPIFPMEFLFRREGSDRFLELAEHGTDEHGRNKLNVKKVIEFPKKPWCEWKIGTQAQMLPGGILPIHGVSISKTCGGKERCGYSMGLAQLDGNLNVVKITDTPLFTRESFKNILPMGVELDPNKDVVYCCGYSAEGDTVKFIINIGDLMTVEVSKTLAELRMALDKSSPIASKRGRIMQPSKSRDILISA